jgi:predicted ester cyclase
MGIPATNKKIAITCLNIYRFKDGKIVGEVGMPDLFGLLNQIGAFGK